MPIHVKDGGVWKEAVAFVKDGGVWKQANLSVRDAGTWKAATAVEVSCLPTFQSETFGSSSRTFSAVTVLVEGGTASSYNWYFTGATGGSFSIFSGQGTSSAQPRVTGVSSGALATLKCDVVVNGQTYTVSCDLSFTNGGGGGL